MKKNYRQHDAIINCRCSAELEVHSPQQRRGGSTGTNPAIGN